MKDIYKIILSNKISRSFKWCSKWESWRFSRFHSQTDTVWLAWGNVCGIISSVRWFFEFVVSHIVEFYINMHSFISIIPKCNIEITILSNISAREGFWFSFRPEILSSFWNILGMADADALLEIFVDVFRHFVHSNGIWSIRRDTKRFSLRVFPISLDENSISSCFKFSF